jgi:hypothetical protein
MKSPPVRRNVTPSSERPKDPEWLNKVPKVERGKSVGRKKRYRRTNPLDEPATDAGEKPPSARRTVEKSADTGRKIRYMLAGVVLVVIGYLLARM